MKENVIPPLCRDVGIDEAIYCLKNDAVKLLHFCHDEVVEKCSPNVENQNFLNMNTTKIGDTELILYLGGDKNMIEILTVV